MGICLKGYCIQKDKDESMHIKNSIKIPEKSEITNYQISSSISEGDFKKNILQVDAEQIFLEDNDAILDQKMKRISLLDFDIVKLLGTGSFGKVYLVKKKDDSTIYAMKVLKKKSLTDLTQINHTKTERLILEKMNNPFIIQLHFAFQTSDKLFLVMDFMQGGEMFFHLKNASKFNEDQTRFIAAEIVLALEYLHKKKIIYRDLKPENILLSIDGHIKLTDFGLSKYGILGI